MHKHKQYIRLYIISVNVIYMKTIIIFRPKSLQPMNDCNDNLQPIRICI